MELKNEKAWNNIINHNLDSYGKRIYQYAQKWAELMENEIKNGKKVKEIANKTRKLINIGKMTFYMRRRAIDILIICWKHGQDLWEWQKMEMKNI